MSPGLHLAQQVIRHDDKLVPAGLRTTTRKVLVDVSRIWSHVAAKAPRAPWGVILLVDTLRTAERLGDTKRNQGMQQAGAPQQAPHAALQLFPVLLP